MKSCQVFFKGPVALVFTQCITASGLAITTDPMLRVPSDAPAELGNAVMTCLGASREGIPNPEDFTAPAKKMVQFAGEKSWGRFAKNAILRAVWLEGEKARIVPYVAAEQGSFDERREQSVQCAHDPLEIGRCLIDSFAR